MAKAKQSYSLRKFLNDVHLWLGIGSGLILFLVCLSGTVYCFRAEIEELLEPAKYHVTAEPSAACLTPEAIIEKVQQQTGGSVASIEIPYDLGQAYQLSVKMSEEERRGTNYYVNPYTAMIQGTSESSTAGFFMVMFRMHRWLLLDSSIGRPIVGVATIIFVVMTLTGLVLWWPKQWKYVKQGLKIKTDANWKRINHDLHNTLGFYSFLLLLVMSLTGLCWSFEWYRDGLSNLLGAEVFGGRGGEPMTSAMVDESTQALTVSDLIRQADQLLPYEGNYRISLPENPEATVEIRKYRSGFFAGSASDQLQLDQYTGQALAVNKFSDKPFAEKITSSIKPLHTGEIFGTFSKLLYFIACLVATSLPITGTIIWINKLKKKARKKHKVRRREQEKNPQVASR